MQKRGGLTLFDVFQTIINGLPGFDIIDLIDILLVAVIIYYILKIASRTRAIQVLKGLGIIIVGAWISEILRLQTLNWVLGTIISTGGILMVILFQPELRKAFEQLGRGKILEAIPRINDAGEPEYIPELTKALLNMSKRRVGALIVIQKSVALGNIIDTGVSVKAVLSAPLLETIFAVNTPLHDGAVVVCDGVVAAAGCFLPLTESDELPKELGTRHRAGIGLSEQSDSLVFIVSEETGIISLAHEGVLTSNLDAEGIRRAFVHEEEEPKNGHKGLFSGRRRKAQ